MKFEKNPKQIARNFVNQMFLWNQMHFAVRNTDDVHRYGESARPERVRRDQFADGADGRCTLSQIGGPIRCGRSPHAWCFGSYINGLAVVDA